MSYNSLSATPHNPSSMNSTLHVPLGPGHSVPVSDTGSGSNSPGFYPQHSNSITGGSGPSMMQLSNEEKESREQDRLLPIANISRIMKKVLPDHAKMNKEAKSAVEDVSGDIFLSSSVASDSDRLIDQQRTSRTFTRNTQNNSDSNTTAESIMEENTNIHVKTETTIETKPSTTISSTALTDRISSGLIKVLSLTKKQKWREKVFSDLSVESIDSASDRLIQLIQVAKMSQDETRSSTMKNAIPRGGHTDSVCHDLKLKPDETNMILESKTKLKPQAQHAPASVCKVEENERKKSRHDHPLESPSLSECNSWSTPEDHKHRQLYTESRLSEEQVNRTENENHLTGVEASITPAITNESTQPRILPKRSAASLFQL